MKNCSNSKCISLVNPQPLRNFRERSDQTAGLRSQCKSCEKEYARKNSEKIKSRSRKWHHENKYRSKLSKIKKNYGLASDEYEKMIEEHKGKCSICKKDSFLVVDHCHSTLKVRGLLCHKCNRGLGFFNDNIKTLKAAIKYLK